MVVRKVGVWCEMAASLGVTFSHELLTVAEAREQFRKPEEEEHPPLEVTVTRRLVMKTAS
jgi:hypothetical protein